MLLQMEGLQWKSDTLSGFSSSDVERVSVGQVTGGAEIQQGKKIHPGAETARVAQQRAAAAGPRTD